ncbi:hypothetical protein Hdeb2414_s0015g00447781 [Helianthus debilis subsp. tardiflorus]
MVDLLFLGRCSKGRAVEMKGRLALFGQNFPRGAVEIFQGVRSGFFAKNNTKFFFQGVRPPTHGLM